MPAAHGKLTLAGCALAIQTVTVLAMAEPPLIAAEQQYRIGPYFVLLYPSQNQLRILDDNSLQPLMHVDFGVGLKGGRSNGGADQRADQRTPPTKDLGVHIIWPDHGTSVAITSQLTEHSVEIQFSWRTARDHAVTDQLRLTQDGVDGVHWYGGAEAYNSTYPLERQTYAMAPYVVSNMLDGHAYGGVQERYWLASSKLAIVAHADDPLWVGWNVDGRLQLKAQVSDSAYARTWPADRQTSLRYSVVMPLDRTVSLRTFHVRTVVDKFGKPSSPPDRRMLAGPIWSTWAQYKKDVSQAKVEEFAAQILAHGFPPGLLEIDDRWARHYGDYRFDAAAFEDPAEMIRQLKLKGFMVTVWVHPFIDAASDLGQDANNSRYFVQKAAPGEGPVTVKWWDGHSHVVDFTNPDARQWFVGNLKAFKDEMGLDGYKFDAGEVGYIGDDVALNDSVVNPNEYSQNYARLAQELGTAIEVRVGTKTQSVPTFVRILDKDSKWGYDNGLKGMVNSALHFSILGYSYVLPDMVGGNAYHQLPDRELFIRWVQANIFLPGLQLSLVPWRYDQEVVDISLAAVKLRNTWADYMFELAEESTRTGEPIIRPMWFLDESVAGLTVDNEYLVGDDLLVAPVLEPNTTSRLVFLPTGRWRCAIDGLVHQGPVTITQTVLLQDLAYFMRVKP